MNNGIQDNDGMVIARFPVVLDSFEGVQSLMKIESVKNMVDKYFYQNFGEFIAKYPVRENPLPNQAKSCKKCGRLGHNVKTHDIPIGLSAEGTRHVLSIIKHGEIMDVYEVCYQIELVLVALVGMGTVLTQDDSPLAIKTIRELKVLYDSVLSWIIHPNNRHARYVRLVSDFTSDLVVISQREQDKKKNRSTIETMNNLLSQTYYAPSTFPRQNHQRGDDDTIVYLFPDYNKDSLADSTITCEFLWRELNGMFSSPNDEAWKRYEYDDVFIAPYDVKTFASCKKCNFIGHIVNTCSTNTPGSKALLCLGTILDPHKGHRLNHYAIRRTLVNVHHLIMSLAYRFWKTNGQCDEKLCKIQIDRVKFPIKKHIRIKCPHLCILMRLYNHAVSNISQHDILGQCITVLDPRRDTVFKIDIGSAGQAEPPTEKYMFDKGKSSIKCELPGFAKEIYTQILGVLSSPDKLPKIIQENHASRSCRTVGISSIDQRTGLDELQLCNDRGDLREEEVRQAAATILEGWQTPHLLPPRHDDDDDDVMFPMFI